MEHSHSPYNFEPTAANELIQSKDNFPRADTHRDNGIVVETVPGQLFVDQPSEYNHVIIEINNDPFIMRLSGQLSLSFEENTVEYEPSRSNELYTPEAENTVEKKMIEEVKQEHKKRNKKVKGRKRKRKKRRSSRSSLNLLGMMIPCSCSSKQLENETINIINQVIAAGGVRPEYMETKLETLEDYGVQSFKREQVIDKLFESIISTIIPKYYSNLLVMAKGNLGVFDANSTFSENEGVLRDRMIETGSRRHSLADATLGYNEIEKVLKNYGDEINTSINNLRNSVKLLHEKTKKLDNFVKKEVLPKASTKHIVAHFKQTLNISNDQDMLELSPLSSPDSNESDSGNPLIHSLELKPPKKRRPNIYDEP